MEKQEDGQQRKDIAAKIARNTILSSLSTRAVTKLLLFSDKLYEPEDSLTIAKGATMIGSILDELSTIQEESPSGVFLLSDGRNTSDDDPTEIAGKLDYPVFTIPIGAVKKENNVRISGVIVNPIVYKGDSVPVTVLVSNNGKSRKNVKVQIWREAKILSRKNISTLEQDVELPIDLYIVPGKEGLVNYEATISTTDDESNKEDNRSFFAIKVKRKRKTVVVIACNLNWDYRFFKHFLIHQKNMNFIGYAKIEKSQFLIQKNNKESKGPIDLGEIEKTDILVLINPQHIDRNLMKLISSRVSNKGMGLLVVGNKLSDLSEFRNMYPFITGGSILTGDIEPKLTQVGHISNLFNINDFTITSFPPLSNPLRIKATKALTKVYLEGKPQGSKNIPILGSVTCGKGKVAAFTVENIWHWKMLSVDSNSGKQLYDQIINNILRFITVENEQEKLILSAPKTKLLWGEPVTLTATLYDDMMNPISEGFIQIHIKKDGKKIKELLMNDVGNGNYQQTINMLKPGRYAVQAQSKFPLNTKSRQTLNIQVQPQEIENLNTEPNPLLLENISHASGGKFIQSDKLQDDLKSIIFPPQILFTRFALHFSSNFTILLIITSIFLLELFLRKLKRLK